MADIPFQLFTSLRYDRALLNTPQKRAWWNFENVSSLYMLDYHRDRMLRAAKHWGWNPAVEALTGEAGLKRLSDLVARAVADKPDGPLRVKVTITKEGELACETSATPATGLANLFPSRLPPPPEAAEEGKADTDDEGGAAPCKQPRYDVMVDAARTARSEYTHFKTTRRAMYDEARSRAGIQASDAKEVLIVNGDDGSIMEGSTTTPYFWREGRWVTPKVSPGFSATAGSGGQDGTTRRWALERYIIQSQPTGGTVG